MRIQEWPVLKLELLFISFQVLVLDWDADSFNCLGGIQRGKKTQNILEPLLLQQAYDLWLKNHQEPSNPNQINIWVLMPGKLFLTSSTRYSALIISRSICLKIGLSNFNQLSLPSVRATHQRSPPVSRVVPAREGTQLAGERMHRLPTTVLGTKRLEWCQLVLIPTELWEIVCQSRTQSAAREWLARREHQILVEWQFKTHGKLKESLRPRPLNAIPHGHLLYKQVVGLPHMQPAILQHGTAMQPWPKNVSMGKQVSAGSKHVSHKSVICHTFSHWPEKEKCFFYT